MKVKIRYRQDPLRGGFTVEWLNPNDVFRLADGCVWHWFQSCGNHHFILRDVLGNGLNENFKTNNGSCTARLSRLLANVGFFWMRGTNVDARGHSRNAGHTRR